MLKFFKHSYIAQLVVIVLLVVALWIPAFLSHDASEDIFDSSGLAMTIFTFVVFGTSVFFFNSMLSVNQLVTRNSSIGAFVFVLCMSCIRIQSDFYPFLLACPIIMMTIQTIYLIYLVEKPEAYLMNAGFFIALASMFYFPSIILIIWVLFAMIIMNIKGWKRFLIPILGFFFPYFILFVYFYFNHTLIESFEEYALIFNGLGFEKLGIKTSEYVALALVFVFLGLSLLMLKSEKADNSVATRKKVGVTLWLFVFGFVMLFMQKPVMCNGLIFIVLAIFVSMALCYIKKSKIIDILLILLMIAIVVNQYLPLLGIVI